jgi:hypothetical protein
MKLTIWKGKDKDGNTRFFVSGYRFFVSAEKLFINDSLAQIDANSKVILDAWEISLRKIVHEETKMGLYNANVEEIDLYTMPYLMIQHLQEGFGDNNTLAVKVIKE